MIFLHFFVAIFKKINLIDIIMFTFERYFILLILSENNPDIVE